MDYLLRHDQISNELKYFVIETWSTDLELVALYTLAVFSHYYVIQINQCGSEQGAIAISEMSILYAYRQGLEIKNQQPVTLTLHSCENLALGEGLFIISISSNQTACDQLYQSDSGHKWVGVLVTNAIDWLSC